MEHIALTMLEISAASAAVILAVALLSSLINRSFTAKWKYWLWMVLAVRLLIPWNFSFESAPARMEVSIPAAPITLPAAPADPVQPINPLPAHAVEPSAPVLTTIELLMLVWLAGTVCFLLWHVVSYLRFRRQMTRWGLPVPKGSSIAAVRQQVEAEFEIGGTIPILICKKVSSPMMIGFFRPLLILPHGEYSTQDLSYILRHELTHYKRRDIWYKALMLLVNAVHWFNPAVWLMVRESSRDLEISCDAAVMQGAGMEERRQYSETILACIHRELRVRTALSTHFYGGKKTLKERFANILSTKKRRTGAIAFAAVLLCGGIIGGLVACSAQEEQPTEDEITDLLQKAEAIYQPGNTEVLSISQYEVMIGELYYDEVVGYEEAVAEIFTEEGAAQLERAEHLGVPLILRQDGKVYRASAMTDSAATVYYGEIQSIELAEMQEGRFTYNIRHIPQPLRPDPDEPQAVLISPLGLTADGESFKIEHFTYGEPGSNGTEGCTHVGLYHAIPNELIDYVGQDRMDAFLEQYGSGEKCNIVNFVTFCQIPKEEFQRLIEEYDLDQYADGSGGPGYNADVIYSGDWELIEAFYTAAPQPERPAVDFMRQALDRGLTAEQVRTLIDSSFAEEEILTLPIEELQKVFDRLEALRSTDENGFAHIDFVELLTMADGDPAYVATGEQYLGWTITSASAVGIPYGSYLIEAESVEVALSGQAELTGTIRRENGAAILTVSEAAAPFMPTTSTALSREILLRNTQEAQLLLSSVENGDTIRATISDYAISYFCDLSYDQNGDPLVENPQSLQQATLVNVLPNDPQTDSVSFQLGPDGVPTELSEGDTLGGWQLQSLEARRNGEILEQVDAVFVGTAELSCTVQLSPMNSGVPGERIYQFTVAEADLHKLPALAGSSGGIDFIQLRDEGVENLSVLKDGERHRCSVLITAYHFFYGPMAVYPRAAILGVTLEDTPPDDIADETGIYPWTSDAGRMARLAELQAKADLQDEAEIVELADGLLDKALYLCDLAYKMARTTEGLEVFVSRYNSGEGVDLENGTFYPVDTLPYQSTQEIWDDVYSVFDQQTGDMRFSFIPTLYADVDGVLYANGSADGQSRGRIWDVGSIEVESVTGDKITLRADVTLMDRSGSSNLEIIFDNGTWKLDDSYFSNPE